jgi:lycopene beta-cyclase
MPVLDTLVVGKGPAALAAAAALGEQGLAVGVLGPAGPVHWPAQYGAWADEMDRPGLADLAQYTWPDTVVRFGEGDGRAVSRAYVRVDRERLARRLLDRCERAGVRWLDGRATTVSHHATHSVVSADDGAEIAARLVVDASGHRPALVRRGAAPAQGYQTAFGFVIDYDGPALPADRALLMDWDDAWLPARERESQPPSFLYALPLGDGRVFVEETVLVARPAVPIRLLEARLRRRLRTLEIPVTRPRDVERCWIPMGGALPDLRQRVVGFGGAASMVHPATGYMLVRALLQAPDLAASTAEALGAADADPVRCAAAAWESVWPRELRRRRALFCFGMEVLLRFDPVRTRAFFDEFFHLPPEDWQGFLSDRLPTPALRAAMARLFLRVPPPVRSVLRNTAIGRPGAHLARSLILTL